MASFSIDYGDGRGPQDVQIPLADDETDLGRILAAPLYLSLPLLTRRLLEAEERIKRLEAMVFPLT